MDLSLNLWTFKVKGRLRGWGEGIGSERSGEEEGVRGARVRGLGRVS